MNDRRPWLALIVFFALCFAAAGIGQWLSGGVPGDWYRSLVKPPFSPPNWLFAPVWTALYAMMAVAGWLVWRRRQRPGAGIGLCLFAVQLVLNAAWTPLFFGLHRPDLAFVEILVLWAAIVAATVWFFRVTVPAGLLLLPYLGWVSFAAVLNGALWRLNP